MSEYQYSTRTNSDSLPAWNETPPPLPPRAGQFLAAPPPAYSSFSGGLESLADPRASSTQSLVPDYSSQEQRRRLLIIYVHGFRGTESSFKSLPAHVHKLLSISLAGTHIVHTKIYPRYYTKGDLKTLAEEFSRWLTPHETPETDIILCGHSLGGLMCADVVLLPPHISRARTPFRHRILGTVSFDAPFLGLHPAVVKTGLKSLFAKYEEPESNAGSSPHGTTDVSGQAYPSSSSQDGYLSSFVTDPNFNPTYANDARLPQPRDMFKDILHFLRKHSDNVIGESKQAIRNHWAYGRTIVTDITGMKDRYTKIRALEDENGHRRAVAVHGKMPVPRVRFVNYYNACTSPHKHHGSQSPSRSPSPAGRRSSKDLQSGLHGGRMSADIERSEQNLTTSTAQTSSDKGRSASVSPRISLEEHRGDEIIHKEIESPPSAEGQQSNPFSPDSTPHGTSLSQLSQLSLTTASEQSSLPTSYPAISKDSMGSYDKAAGLPPIPPVPIPPQDLDLSQYPDKESLKLAQKIHAREVKAHKQAVKDRNAAIKERQKYEEKIRKIARKTEGARLKAEQKEKKELDKARAAQEKSTSTLSVPSTQNALTSPSQLSIPRSDDEDDGAPTIASALGPPDHSLNRPPMSENESPLNAAPPITSPHDTGESSTAQRTAADIPPASTPHAHRSAASSSSSAAAAIPAVPAPKRKTQKFCILPSKVNGQHDPAWVRVLMEGIDPPAAHTALFSPTTRTYEQLVGDVASRIEEWVEEDVSRRYAETLDSTR